MGGTILEANCVVDDNLNKMNKVSIFQFKGVDIELTYKKGSLVYGIEKEGKNYGISIKLEKKGVMDVASAAFLLLTNAVETIEKLNENQ